MTASQAAKFQAYQTRARMGAQLWSQIIMVGLLTWLGLTLYVVWYKTASYFPPLQQHPYFWRWVIGGVLNDTPLLNLFASRLKLPLAHNWYPLPGVMEWLDSPEVYHASFYIWFAHFVVRTAVLPVGLAAVAIMWKVRHQLDAEHLRGLRLLLPREHNRQLNGGLIYRSAQRAFKPAVGGRGIRLGASIIPEIKENEHFLITGSPGAGKSTLIRQMLYQIQERQQSAIVIDPDCEFIQEFYDEARGDAVLNPLDARCPFWSPWLEFRDESFTMDAESMAASLLRGHPRNATETFFLESSRTLIEAMFAVVRDRSTSDGIMDFLAMPREEIQQALTGTRAYPLIDPGAHEQGSGILATVANAMKSFHYLPARDQSSRVWSAREWAQDRRGWVFLASTEDGRAAIQRLQGVWLDSLVRWLMCAEIGGEQIWIMADELPALEYQPQIEKLVTRGRKRGLAVVMGFQNVSQLRSIYGRDGAVTLTSSPTTKVILRCDEAETAKWASDLLGSREIERIQMTQLAGLSTYREGVNLQPQRSIEHLVLPAEVQKLAPFHGYLCIAGNDRTTIRIPEQHLAGHHPAFVPRSSNSTEQPVSALRRWSA